jgi:hypothetical protein
VGNWAKQNFFKGQCPKGQKHIKKGSASLAIKEMQIKITLRFHLTPVRIASIKNTTTNKCWHGCGEKRTLIHWWWEYELLYTTTLVFFFLFFISFIHMCIQWLGHYSPLPPAPSFSPITSLLLPPPHFQADTVLPLSLILYTTTLENHMEVP